MLLCYLLGLRDLENEGITNLLTFVKKYNWIAVIFQFIVFLPNGRPDISYVGLPIMLYDC
jgi:hypothetical protein